MHFPWGFKLKSNLTCLLQDSNTAHRSHFVRQKFLRCARLLELLWHTFSYGGKEVLTPLQSIHSARSKPRCQGEQMTFKMSAYDYTRTMLILAWLIYAFYSLSIDSFSSEFVQLYLESEDSWWNECDYSNVRKSKYSFEDFIKFVADITNGKDK